MEPLPQPSGPTADDLFTSEQVSGEQVSGEPPSESAYAEVGEPELRYIGEVQLPRPVPVEITIEVDGFDYTYKLDRRSKAT